MPVSPSVRLAHAGDASCLAVLANQVWLHTYATEGISQEIASYTLSQLTPEKYLSVINDRAAQLWVAESGGHLIGFAIAKFGVPCPARSKSTVELETLYVQEHFVGQGIGKLLLQAAQAWGRSQSGTALWLTVNARNANAIAFYGHLGYTKIGTAQFVLGQSQHENHVLLGPEI